MEGKGGLKVSKKVCIFFVILHPNELKLCIHILSDRLFKFLGNKIDEVHRAQEYLFDLFRAIVPKICTYISDISAALIGHIF